MITSLMLLGGLLLGQTDAASESLSLEVRRLVRQLDASQLRLRDEAEQRLIELGPAVLDLLPPPSDRTPAEVRQRLGRVRQKLQRALAESVIDASHVTLDGELPLSKIIAAFTEQTGNKIVDEGLLRPGMPQPSIRVAFDDRPFWPALDEVLDASGLEIDPYQSDRAIKLSPRSEFALPRSGRADYSGPFRFEPVRIEAVRDLQHTVGQSLRLTIEVAWEPRLAPVTIEQRMADVKVLDGHGNPLAIDNRQAQLEVPVRPGAIAVPLTIPMGLPGRDVTEIAQLKGSLTVLVPGKIETFRFDELEGAENIEKRVAGVTVRLDKVRKNNSIWEVLVRVRFDEAQGALASHRNWIYENEAYLENPQGEPVSFDAFETTRQTENEVGVAYLFAVDGPLKGYKFVYKTPGAILSRTVDYAIKNVPLP